MLFEKGPRYPSETSSIKQKTNNHLQLPHPSLNNHFKNPSLCFRSVAGEWIIFLLFHYLPNSFHILSIFFRTQNRSSTYKFIVKTIHFTLTKCHTLTANNEMQDYAYICALYVYTRTCTYTN